MPSFDHNEANRLTEAANAAQLKPTNEAPQHSESDTVSAGEPINRPSIRPFKHGQWQGFGPPTIPPPPAAAPPQCGSDAMSRISKGCCRANRGRETRTNCILTHANCQCPHLPTPLSPFACVLLRRASLLHYSGQVRDGRMDGWTTVAYGPQLPLCTLPTDVECVGS